MTSTPNPTHTGVGVSFRREDSEGPCPLAPTPPDGGSEPSPTDVLPREHPAYPLACIYEIPGRIRAETYKDPVATPPTFVGLAWTINQLTGGDGRTKLASPIVYKHLPDGAEEEIRRYSSRGKSGLEAIQLRGEALHRHVKTYRESGTIVGREKAEWQATALTRSAFDQFNGSGTDAAKVLDAFIADGNLSKLERHFNARQGPPPPDTAQQGASPAAEAEGATTPTSRPAAAPNEPNLSVVEDLFASGPMTRLSSYRGRFRPEVKAVSGVERVGFGLERVGFLGHETRNRRTIADVPVAKQRPLLRREPLGWVPDKPRPTKLYNDIIEWRPILEWSQPLMAIYQLILTSTLRDDNAAIELDCTGMPLACELICGAFGYAKQAAWNAGLNAGIFLELYQSYVDSDLTWSDWNHQQNRARVVLNHSIPQAIMDDEIEFMATPEAQRDRTFLLSGSGASTADALRPERDKRRRAVDENKPIVPAPESALMMKEYLNGLNRVNVFSHGSHGVFTEDTIQRMIQTAKEEIPEEQRRRMELEKIYGIRSFPKPLYAACDRSPRLRADAHNQVMNVHTPIRRAIYDPDKDIEFDLDKAHLTSYIPTVRRQNIETPLLDKYLEASTSGDTSLLERGDLWWELACACDTAEFDDMEALRNAVKRIYSVPYGMERSRVLHMIAKDYDLYTGHYPETHKPLEPILSHPLVEELLATREKLKTIINDQGGLRDANGRFIELSHWNETKTKGDRWRGLMSYVNASFETEVVAAPFEEAAEEKANDAITKWKIWLYQGDGFTVRVGSQGTRSVVEKRLKTAVAERARKYGVPTKLTIDWPE